jgi:predicted nucleotidyltransferase
MKTRDKNNLKILDVLKIFLEEPYKEFYLRETARKLRISPNTVNRSLNRLVKERLILDRKKANLRYFKANIESPTFKYMKITFSLKQIEDSGLLNSLKEISSHVVLFGSVAQGLDSKLSDIDLLIIGDKNKIKQIILKYQKKLDKELTPYIFSWSEWKRQAKENKAFYNDIIIKGVNLIGEKPITE